MAKRILKMTALLVLMMIANFNLANAQTVNMNRWVELSVKHGSTIYFQLSATADNTPIRVVSGRADSTFTVNRNYNSMEDPRYSCYAGATTMKIYGNLRVLFCDKNRGKIMKIDASNNDVLERLNCGSNDSITSINVNGCTALQGVFCYYNNLSSLNFGGHTALQYLRCWNNNITHINLSGCSALEELLVADNKLNSLDITDCSALKVFGLYGNDFSTQALDIIYCSLPTRSSADNAIMKVLSHPTNDPGLAKVLATNKQNAINKGWRVKEGHNGNDIPATTGTYVCGSSTGVEQIENFIAIYPNPASDVITVETDVVGSAITITDLAGRVVLQATATDSKTTLDIHHLTVGTYIVRVGERVGKIVKK